MVTKTDEELLNTLENQVENGGGGEQTDLFSFESIVETVDDYEMEESLSSELVDRISELPQALILLILSFLPMRDVVSTTLVSKSWKNLWTTIPCLNFYVDMSRGDRDTNFVNRVLMLWKGKKIFKFEIVIKHHFYVSSARDMYLWVQFAVKYEVEELNIDLSYDTSEICRFDTEMDQVNYEEDVCCVPQCLYLCSSIRKLRLVGCNLGNHGSVSWNQLESLSINGYCFSASSIDLIMSGSPLLKVFELRFLENEESLDILSTSLKELKIEKSLYSHDDHPSTNTVLRIRCPNLQTLEVSGALYSKCLLTDVSSLTDAAIKFYDSTCFGTWQGKGNKVLEDMLIQILSMIQHVEKVTLSSWCVKVLGESRKKYLLSPIQNVKYLKLDECTIGFGDMMDLLGIFPNLKMLIIGYLHFLKFKAVKFEANMFKSCLLQLETVETASSNLFDSSNIWFFKFLLKRATMLQKLVIRVNDIDDHLREVAEKLLRSSPSVEVIFKCHKRPPSSSSTYFLLP